MVTVAEPDDARAETQQSDDREMLAGAYDEIRRIARGIVGRGGPVQLDPTELAHEAAIKLMLSAGVYDNKGHMLATAARALRQTLIDEMRKASAAKRLAPGPITIALIQGHPPLTLEWLDEAVRELEAIAPENARLVELRFMLGMTIEESAVALGISPRTVKRKWAATRAWLQDMLARHADFAQTI